MVGLSVHPAHAQRRDARRRLGGTGMPAFGPWTNRSWSAGRFDKETVTTEPAGGAGIRLAYDVGGGTLGGLYPLEDTSGKCAENQLERSRNLLEDPLIHGLDDTDSEWYRSRSLVNYVDRINVPIHIAGTGRILEAECLLERRPTEATAPDQARPHRPLLRLPRWPHPWPDLTRRD